VRKRVPLLRRLLNPIAVLGWFLAAILLLVGTNLRGAGSDDLYRKIRLFSEVLKDLNDNYWTEVGGDSLIDGAIDGMLDQLDPHTVYFTPSEARSFLTEMKGEYGGFGITVEQQDGYIVILEALPGYSAERAGMQPGDRILNVDGLDMVNIPMEKAFSIFRGPAGTHAQVTVRRDGLSGDLTFDLERKIIQINNVPYVFRMDDGVGYVRVREFSNGVAAQMREQIDQLEKLGIRGLIVDMRYNPGGSLDEAVDMVNDFIGPGKLVVSSKGRSPDSNRDYFTKYQFCRSGYPVIVLINRYSASAAEIFAGSLQDYDAALVMGETSFGKGSVQTMFPLSSGMIKITIAHYYLASGRCIHRDENDRLLRGKAVSDSERAQWERHRKTDAHFTQRGRVVYGGGGIKPDIPVDPALAPILGDKLRRDRLFGAYALDYDKSHVVTPNFQVDEPIRNEFLAFARGKGILYTDAELDSAKSYIDASLAGAIIANKLGEVEGYKAQIALDQPLMEAVAMFGRFPTLEAMLQYAESMKKEP
jgi:carboxyl-terminal processing protease